MLIFGFLLVPMVLAKLFVMNRGPYVFKIEDRSLKVIEEIGEPRDSIDLSGLYIDRIDNYVFENLSHVKSVNLTNNYLEDFPRYSWSYRKDIENLSLANNRLRYIPYGQFTRFNNLKYLNLLNNPIKQLRPGCFYGLGKSTNISIGAKNKDWILFTLAFDNFDEDRYYNQGRISFIPSEMDVPIFDETIWRYIGSRDSATVCIRDGIVDKLEPHGDSVTDNRHCKVVLDNLYVVNDESGNETRKLILNNLGIFNFAAGWYRLDGNFFHGLELSNNNITDLTAEFLNDLPANIKTIDLSNNKIVRLKSELFVNKNIKNLNLGENLIDEIEDGALDKTELMYLDLRKNRLNNTRFVKTLPLTLQTLLLSENCIDELSTDEFFRFLELDKIDLAGNNISVIKNESLRGFGSVKRLVLKKNQIEEIEIGAFQNMKSLRYLDLGYNKIKKITPDIVRGLPETMHTLFLSFNQIDILKAGTFSKVPKQELYINDNKIRKIESGTFDSRTLRNLYLQNNFLSQINGDEFAGIDNLRDLDLSNNGITKIEKGFAKHFGNVSKLILADNPIEILEKGALFGIAKTPTSIVELNNVQLQVLQGGVFDDL